MKSLKILLAGAVLGLSACGDGGIQSPDFTPVLDSIVIDDASATAPIGRQVQLQALGRFTNPPGSSQPLNEKQVTASFEVSDTNIATVDGNGVFVGRQLGTVTVTASKDGKTSPPVSIQVIAPVLDQIVVTPATATIAVGATQLFTAQGLYTDSTTPRAIVTPIAWASDAPAIATVSPPTGTSTTATGVATGNTLIRASSVNEEGETISGTAALTVGNAAVTSLLRVEPANAFVAVGLSQQYTAIGSFTNGTEQAVMNSQIDWSEGTPAVATVDDNGLATGISPGQSTIIATLRPSSGASGTASTVLTVTDSVCTLPFVASAGATAVGATNGLCVGCNVSDPGALIDGVPTTLASIRVPLGLFNGNASLTATAAASAADFPGGVPVGFVVARPAGLIVTAELLSQLQISTLSNGNVVETSSSLIPLRVTLLGLLGSDQLALVSFTPGQAFDGLRLTFNSGVASALTSTNVAAACAAAAEPSP